jgi:hypothetical protein
MKSIFKIVFLFLLVLISLSTRAQLASVSSPKHRGSFSMLWGYNRDWFSKSDLHFKGKDYNFTVHDATAKDRPQFARILDWEATIPQFYYRFGYVFNRDDMWGIEGGFDHVKYVMVQDQVAHVTGTIHDTLIDKDTVMTSEFLRFEHTNGANFLELKAIKGFMLLSNHDYSHLVYFIGKVGGGVVIPRTDVRLFNVRRDNQFHVAGYVGGVEGALRYVYNKHWLAETAAKYSFANYTNVLTVGDDSAHHYFFCFEWLFSVGYQFNL